MVDAAAIRGIKDIIQKGPKLTSPHSLSHVLHYKCAHVLNKEKKNTETLSKIISFICLVPCSLQAGALLIFQAHHIYPTSCRSWILLVLFKTDKKDIFWRRQTKFNE